MTANDKPKEERYMVRKALYRQGNSIIWVPKDYVATVYVEQDGAAQGSEKDEQANDKNVGGDG